MLLLWCMLCRLMLTFLVLFLLCVVLVATILATLVLLTLQQPFADAMVANHLAGRPEPEALAWTVPSIGSDGALAS